MRRIVSYVTVVVMSLGLVVGVQTAAYAWAGGKTVVGGRCTTDNGKLVHEKRLHFAGSKTKSPVVLTVRAQYRKDRFCYSMRSLIGRRWKFRAVERYVYSNWDCSSSYDSRTLKLGEALRTARKLVSTEAKLSTVKVVAVNGSTRAVAKFSAPDTSVTAC